MDKELTLEAIAAETNFSPYYFARLFKRSTGLTPYQYVTQCRMKKAKSLLAKGNLAILEVGQQVGFHNQSHFSNVFRKFTGITPKAYQSAFALQKFISYKNYSSSQKS